MRIMSKYSYFCFATSGYASEIIREFCYDRICAECIVGDIKKEFCGSTLEIDVKLGLDIGLVGEEEI